jgi:hypothetical protein
MAHTACQTLQPIHPTRQVLLRLDIKHRKLKLQMLPHHTICSDVIELHTIMNLCCLKALMKDMAKNSDRKSYRRGLIEYLVRDSLNRTIANIWFLGTLTGCGNNRSGS